MAAEGNTIHIFGDESSQRGHKYLAYGTMDCPRSQLPTITALLNGTKKNRREFKWSGELSRDLTAFVDTIFVCRTKHGLSFRSMVVNTSHSDHRKYNEGDAYLGLEKYIFVHLLGYARRQHMTSTTRFAVTLDKLKDNHQFDRLRRALNSRVRNESGRHYDMYSEVIGVDSHTHILVQAADVLTGCVAWVWNKRYEKQSDPERVALAEQIARLANLGLTDRAKTDGVKHGHYMNFGYSTWRHQETHGFAIWELNLRKEMEAELRSLSIEQLACFPPDMTFAALAERGVKPVMRCIRCDRRNPNILELIPSFSQRPLSDRYRPKCQTCNKRGILLLRPDPLKRRASSEIERMPVQVGLRLRH
jgi:hypothetical protein